MQLILEAKERRFYRLKSYFAPYPEFKLVLRREIDSPAFEIEVNKASEGPAEAVQAPSFVFSVASLILTEDAPEWMEAYLLLMALDTRSSALADESSAASKPDGEIETYRSQILEIFKKHKNRAEAARAAQAKSQNQNEKKNRKQRPIRDLARPQKAIFPRSGRSGPIPHCLVLEKADLKSGFLQFGPKKSSCGARYAGRKCPSLP